MKVRELIADSVFTPGAGRESARAPRVTVILPTFRRGDSGLLARALDSLLGQSFDDFEIIVVDDASTDSTARVVAAAMRRDPRISVLRHARNIGLPAVSEYEAYLLARGELISFAFDDTVFYRHALRRLVRESEREPGALIAGYVTAFSRAVDGTLRSDVLGRDARESDLLSGNVIPNNAVLAPKSLLAEVGLYDPHVALARLCDYDLWLRVRRKHPIRFAGMCIGEEHGPATNDSLAATYTLDRWLSDDRIRQHRDELLRPENFGDVDVFDDSSFASPRSREAVRSLVAGHVAARPHLTAPVRAHPDSLRVPRILVLARPIDASVQLVFEGLRDVPDLHVRLADPHRYPISELGGADVLVVARQIGDNGDWIRAARATGLPVLYYLDDNLPLMAGRGELDSHRAAEFAIDRLRREVSRLDGVLTSTESLAASFREQRLHPAITVLPLASPRVVTEDWPHGTRRDARPPTFALFVGPHRLRSFRRRIWPALVAAARDTRTAIRVLVPEQFLTATPKVAKLHDPAVEIVPFRQSSDYFVALRDLDRIGVDAVVIPDARTANSEFKTVHPFLSAAALGATLIISETAPYRELRAETGVILVDDPRTNEAWAHAFGTVVRAIHAIPRDERVVDAGVLATRFAPATGAERLLTAVAAGPTPPSPERRTQQLADWLAIELARTRSALHGAAIHASGPGSAAGHGETASLSAELHDTVRLSRRLNAFGGAPSALARFDRSRQGELSGNGRERIEIGRPLASVPYLSYPVTLAPGRYDNAVAWVWADGAAGDLLGLEVVDPRGRIVLHSVAALPRTPEPVEVAFDAGALDVESTEAYELRVFARTTRPAFLLEAVDRGVLGIRRPRVRPLVSFVSR